MIIFLFSIRFKNLEVDKSTKYFFFNAQTKQTKFSKTIKLILSFNNPNMLISLQYFLHYNLYYSFKYNALHIEYIYIIYSIYIISFFFLILSEFFLTTREISNIKILE